MTRGINSTRLKFELIEPQTSDRAVSPLAQLSSRLRREEQPPQPQARPRLVQDLAQGLDFLMVQLADAESARDRARDEVDRWKLETSKMRAEIADLQREVKATSEGPAEVRATRQTLESVVSEQQKALLLSMELMHRFESEIGSLRVRVDAMESVPAPVTVPPEALLELETLRTEQMEFAAEKRANEGQNAELIQRLETALRDNAAARSEAVERLEEKNRAFEDLSARGRESHTSELAVLNGKLDSALKESAKLRAELAEQTKRGDPAAAIRALEEQRDIARTDAASARADVSIQSAEIETKDAIIGALERALEQQHGSLRNLEQRFAEYATRLQELRLDRLKMPDAKSSRTSSGAPGIRTVLEGLKRTFSPSAKPEVEPKEESSQ